MKKIIFLVAGVVALLIAVFVWPTPYRYEKMAYGDGETYMIRISRLTGEAEKLTPEGWNEMRPLNEAERAAIQLEAPAPAPAAPAAPAPLPYER